MLAAGSGFALARDFSRGATPRSPPVCRSPSALGTLPRASRLRLWALCFALLAFGFALARGFSRGRRPGVSRCAARLRLRALCLGLLAFGFGQSVWFVFGRLRPVSSSGVMAM
jgi:hypothetical protein